MTAIMIPVYIENIMTVILRKSIVRQRRCWRRSCADENVWLWLVDFVPDDVELLFVSGVLDRLFISIAN